DLRWRPRQGLGRQDRPAQPAAPPRPAEGDRRHGAVPGQRRCLLRQRPGDPGRWRAQQPASLRAPGMSSNDSLELLHTDMARAHMAPTWVHLSEFVAKEPRVSYRPFLWKWRDVVPLLRCAGDLITPERGAERRSMEHVNPDLRPQFSTSHTI